MAAALECWSGRPSTDEDMVEQVLMKNNDRSESEAFTASTSSTSNPPTKWQRIGRNFAGAVAALKTSLHPDSAGAGSGPTRLVWAAIVRNLTQLYPGSQLPDRLLSNVRRHFDSLPTSYSQAGFDMKEVLLHVRLIDQASSDDLPAVHVQQIQGEAEDDGVVFQLTFASNSALSWSAISEALDSSSICCKKIQIFEKKGLTLAVVTVLVQPGDEKVFKSRIDAALKLAGKKPRNAEVKFPFGLCGCHEGVCQNAQENGDGGNGLETEMACRVKLPVPLPEATISVIVDEWQIVRSDGDDVGQWLLSSNEVEIVEQAGLNSFRGSHKGMRIHLKKLKGCERGNVFEFEVRQDLLQLMSSGHKNILQFHGICIQESHGLCVVTKMMDGGSVHALIQKKKKLAFKDVMRIALDVAEGLMFMNHHGVAYKDLNSQRILLDKQGNACLGDMGIVASGKNIGEVTEYETAGYQWLAPEIIAGDPESVIETWMSNVYSFGMVIWEMVTGEAAYSSYSPVQAAVGIATCGLRPEIPKDCPQVLKSVMIKCWNNCPSERPEFSEIISILGKHNNR
ncbi:serine/threonine-protein kinase TNNI3K-like isoform X2 [Dioscorea cayenensis subsp. rotundata]|uniref:Serine/threonine-protein kinase TNNI3K-like isoform X2 n=1 Tax=Dioscorea cayennensis subsp. rotundata TaxID=55577 RepID=A0AB40BMA5_DIOCR|nr:serine/threonine-protein kinase TNNI3K-like isoform X2 [Dioscorea cayenensis subsp. rotundata]